MTRYQDRTFESTDGLSLYYREYPGPGAAARPVLCLPGLTRNSRDFEELAAHLAERRRVLCPDLRGRGRSEYDPNSARYTPGTYVGDVIALLAAAAAPRVIVIGTSLGGLLAMMLTAMQRDAVAGVVLNDVGPEIDPRGLERIRGYVGKGKAVASWDQAADAVRSLNAELFPGFERSDWLRLARRSYAERDDGLLHPDYDPRIADPFGQSGGATPAADMWPLYTALESVPTLSIRGSLSDILSAKTVERMAREKPDLVVLNVANRGHAPLLDEPECIEAIDRFVEPL